MLVLIPIVVVLAGIALLYTHRRYKASKSKEPSRVVVQGHTFSESVEQKPATDVRMTRNGIDTVRQCCVVGAGRVGAITGIVLAMQNPDAQFCIADTDERMINAWNSDSLPLYEPGLEEVLFDDQSLSVRDTNASTMTEQPDSNGKYTYTNIEVDYVQRRRRLPNLTFSTNVHAAAAAAELIFLCVEMERSGFNEPPVTHTYLNPTLQTIAHASTGHKIIVQRTTAPYGTTQYIKNHLNQISSPNATYTILTNPDFTLPGSTLSDTVHPQRVIIGHIYTPAASTESITALKRLYTPWVPEERLVTMDAWSAELGRIASKASLAQRVVEAKAVGMLCAGTEASAGNVGWMVGCGLDCGTGTGIGWLRSDVRCFVGLAGELGMGEVESYWRGVLRMDEVLYKRGVEGLVRSLPEGGRKVAVVGFGWDIAAVPTELRRSGASVRVWDGSASKEQVQDMLQAMDSEITVAESLEDACLGCSAVVVHGHSGIDHGAWQTIADQMEEPKTLLDTAGVLDRARVRQLGLRAL